MEHGAEKVILSSYYELSSAGCNLEDRYVNPFFPVTLLNSADYGFQYIDGVWKVQIDQRVLE